MNTDKATETAWEFEVGGKSYEVRIRTKGDQKCGEIWCEGRMIREAAPEALKIEKDSEGNEIRRPETEAELVERERAMRQREYEGELEAGTPENQMMLRLIGVKP